MNRKTTFRDKHRITILRVFAILIISIVICQLAVPVAHAEEFNASNWDRKMAKIEEGPAGALGKAAFEFAAVASGAHPLLAPAAVAIEILRINFGSASYSSQTYSIMDVGASVYEMLQIVGVLLMLLYLLIDILDEVQVDHFTVEHLIKKLIVFAVALLVLQQGGKIFKTITEIGDALMDDVNDAFSAAQLTSGTLGTLYAELTSTAELGIFDRVGLLMKCIGIILDNILGYILGYVALIFVWLTSFSRFIEILVRTALAPIGLAPLVSGGAKGAGMKYLKKFASVVLQGAVIIAAIKASSVISSALGGLNAVLAPILMPLTLIGFLSKVPGIADDIVGV